MPFALVPVLAVSIQITSIVVSKEAFNAILQTWGEMLSVELYQLLTTAVAGTGLSSSLYGIPFGGYLFLIAMIALTFAHLSAGLRKVWINPVRGWQQYLYDLVRAVLFFICLQIFFIAVVLGETIFAQMATSWFVEIVSRAYLFLLTVILLTVGYRVLVPRSPSYLACLVGSLAVAALFVTLQTIIGWWLAISPVSNVYGAANVLLVLLVWVYITACVIYYGAAIAWVFDEYQAR
jgi:membrane protein